MGLWPFSEFEQSFRGLALKEYQKSVIIESYAKAKTIP